MYYHYQRDACQHALRSGAHALCAIPRSAMRTSPARTGRELGRNIFRRFCTDVIRRLTDVRSHQNNFGSSFASERTTSSYGSFIFTQYFENSYLWEEDGVGDIRPDMFLNFYK